MRPRASFSAALQAWWLGQCWQASPTLGAQLLRPLAWLYGRLLAGQRHWQPAAEPTPVPVVVVGNFVVGGAGKTPVVMALVQALLAAGMQPGVVSRGFGRRSNEVTEVRTGSLPDQVGDEPLLIRRRTHVPVWVGRQRLAAARALCAQHPEVDVLVSDDGLQHHALARAAELVVFDERGVGNGLLLPAGPLREPLPRVVPARMRLLYANPLPGLGLKGTAIQRQAGRVMALEAWWLADVAQAIALAALRGRPLLAVAGIAAPEKFFAMLEAAGLHISPCPMPDHARYDTLPWPAGTPDVITTEKDAVKLPPGCGGGTRVWVVGLDLVLPADLVRDVMRLLGRPKNDSAWRSTKDPQ